MNAESRQMPVINGRRIKRTIRLTGISRRWVYTVRLCQIILLVAIVQLVPIVSAQTPTPPLFFGQPLLRITRENVAEIEQILWMGKGTVRALTFGSSGERLAVATALGVWTAEIPGAAPEMQLFEGQNGAWSAAFSPDGRLIAGGGDDGSVAVWDVTSGEQVARLENHLYPVSALAWSADGRWVASGDWSGIVRVWAAETWSEYRVLPTDERIERLRFDGSQLTALSVETSTTWDVEANSVLSQSRRTEDLGNNTDVTFDERRAFWDETAGVVEIWDNGEQIAMLEGFSSGGGGVAFVVIEKNGVQVWNEDAPAVSQVTSPDRQREATFGNDGIIRLLDAASGDQVAALYGHIRRVNAVAFSPDGTLLASASDDGTIQLWDATTDEDSGSLVTLRGHTSGVTDVVFSSDGTALASVGYDGTVRMWGIISG